MGNRTKSESRTGTQLQREWFIPESVRCACCTEPVLVTNQKWGSLSALKCLGCAKWFCDRCTFLRGFNFEHDCRARRAGTYRGAE